MTSEQSLHNTVLVVEDDEVLSGILARGLVVPDVLPPKTDGLELAARLASLEAPPAILFVSGIAEGRDIPGPVLPKPFGPMAFLEEVARLLPTGRHH